MEANILNKWWQEYRKNVYTPRQKHRSNQLHHELTILLHDRADTAQRLVNLEKMKHPGQPESWYLDKVIYDLQREA